MTVVRITLQIYLIIFVNRDIFAGTSRCCYSLWKGSVKDFCPLGPTASDWKKTLGAAGGPVGRDLSREDSGPMGQERLSREEEDRLPVLLFFPLFLEKTKANQATFYRWIAKVPIINPRGT